MTIVATAPGRQKAPRRLSADIDLGDRDNRQFAALVWLDELFGRFGGRLTPTVPLRHALQARTAEVVPVLVRAVCLLLSYRPPSSLSPRGRPSLTEPNPTA
jgi:hypothetical protein